MSYLKSHLPSQSPAWLLKHCTRTKNENFLMFPTFKLCKLPFLCLELISPSWLIIWTTFFFQDFFLKKITLLVAGLLMKRFNFPHLFKILLILVKISGNLGDNLGEGSYILRKQRRARTTSSPCLRNPKRAKLYAKRSKCTFFVDKVA